MSRGIWPRRAKDLPQSNSRACIDLYRSLLDRDRFGQSFVPWAGKSGYLTGLFMRRYFLSLAGGLITSKMRCPGLSHTDKGFSGVSLARFWPAGWETEKCLAITRLMPLWRLWCWGWSYRRLAGTKQCLKGLNRVILAEMVPGTAGQANGWKYPDQCFCNLQSEDCTITDKRVNKQTKCGSCTLTCFSRAISFIR